ncbi:Protein-arginine deiminase (PAD) [Botrimarina colliarenosi]|uniref:Protein-arginine deiminase (PAD) n=1 Tax=Botrimarina colliarenosi TaxID=2528001 RepID=A0A5C6AC16_9BACT|nr:protein-arginine deiminase family protein [Botrimarina colliarenosi]TWT96611.1 Protein-arginine deiminase (PAD) [Botrimarina colliarenosi]
MPNPSSSNAPLLVRSSLAPASTVFVRELPGRNDVFVAQLAAICKRVGAELHVVPAGEPYAENHVWMQDAVEFLERSDGSGTVALLGVRNQAIDDFAKHRLPGVETHRVGAYREAFASGESTAGEAGDSWIDWFGNLEASPPTAMWPNGRVLYGVNPATDGQLHPDVVAFLAEQGLQEPLALDVGWLTVRHVDEMSSFLPAKDGGFYVAVPDPLAALALLERLDQEGQGATPLLSPYEEGTTVASILADEDFVRHNERLWRERIEPAARTLVEGIGADVDRLIGLPVMFRASGESRTPNVVNCLVLPGRDGAAGQIAMSDPHGPMVEGEDVFQADIRKRLADVDAEIHFVDDRQYHKWAGNVHCATNAIRPLKL